MRLADVARAAGVHTATASRALSPREEIVRTVTPTTRDLVQETAERLGYRPNRQGRALRTGRSLMLGLLVPHISDTVLSAVYEGMLAEAQRSSYSVLVANTADHPTQRQELIQELIDHGVDGIIYTDAHLSEPLPAGHPVPVLQAYRYSQPPGGIVVDDEEGGAQVARHLVASGHERFAVLAGYDYASSTSSRARGFVAELERHGVDRAKVQMEHSGLRAADGRGLTEQLLAGHHPPTAIFAVDDYLALGVLSAATAAGLRIGHDLAVVGYNNLSVGRELPVSLSTVAVDLDELGAAAVHSLLGVLEGEPPVSERLRPRLEIRRSSSPEPGGFTSPRS